MKIAVISDIHSNLYALMKVFEDIDDQKIDKVICLGDLVGYGPHPNEVIALIKVREIPCLKGNYDASVVNDDYTFIRNNTVNYFSLPWTVNELRSAHIHFLDSLPKKLVKSINGVNILFTHGSPFKIDEYLFEDSENTKRIMKSITSDILVCAHTHIPFIKKFGNKTLVNVGSVGKPKIGNPNCTYAILDFSSSDDIQIRIREVEYEYQRVMKDCTMLGFPSTLIDSYRIGLE